MFYEFVWCTNGQFIDDLVFVIGVFIYMQKQVLHTVLQYIPNNLCLFLFIYHITHDFITSGMDTSGSGDMHRGEKLIMHGFVSSMSSGELSNKEKAFKLKLPAPKTPGPVLV
jgi:hypothetical protein